MRAIAGWMVAAALTAVLATAGRMGIPLLVKAHAQEVTPVGSVCSVAMLNGVYGFQRHGTKTDGTLITAVGTGTLDGQGNTSDFQEWTSRNGVVTHAVFAPGTYTVDADCTGAFVDPAFGTLSRFVVVRGGDEILAMSLSSGNSVWARYERVATLPLTAAGAAPAHP
jgi:hypothetical protein